MFRKILDEGQAGDNVEYCYVELRRKMFKECQVLAKPGVALLLKKFSANLYVLNKEEGGRHTAFFKNYSPTILYVQRTLQEASLTKWYRNGNAW